MDKDQDKDRNDIELSTPIPPPLTDSAQSSRITPPALPPRDGIPAHLLLRERGDKAGAPTKTFTTITWPPALETHMITARFYEGVVAMTTTLSAHESTNGTFFPSYTLSLNTTTTKSPPTTVLGMEPPPPYTSGVSPASNSEGGPGSSGTSKAALIRTWALVVAGIVLVGLVGGFALRQYRRRIGRAKKQEPVRHFMTVGEDDGESDRGGGDGGGGVGADPGSLDGIGGPGASIGGTGIGTGLETLPDGSIALSNLGASSSQQNYNNQNSGNNVRERRNSQPVPRQLELDAKLR